jgi:hypothetical protein
MRKSMARSTHWSRTLRGSAWILVLPSLFSLAGAPTEGAREVALDEAPTAAPADVPALGQLPADQAAFWANLQALCGSAAPGTLLQAPDAQISPDAALVVHFWECGAREIRFPLHVDDNRSRTWIFIRHDDRLELRHDHRNPDGTEESNTWYGAETLDAGTANRQAFVNERNGVRTGWRVEIEPGVRYVYGTIRNDDWRHHLEFDLTSLVAPPPMHWGHETRPSQRPNPDGVNP